MQVKSIAECSKGIILQYIRPSLCYHLSLRSVFCLFLSGPLRQVLLYSWENFFLKLIDKISKQQKSMQKFPVGKELKVPTAFITVKTLYNVTRYNRIFNIRHKIAGNGSVSIKIPTLLQNIHLTTPTVTSMVRYTISIENKFIITELLPRVRQFCDPNKVFLHEQVSV